MSSLEEPQIRTSRIGFEVPVGRPSSARRLRRDCGVAYIGAGATGVLFSATGPVAVILAAGTAGSLTGTQIASWIFGVFVLNGILTLITSWVYRMPLAFFWTIPGTVIVGQALPGLEWSDVIGAYVVTGILIFLLGASGLVARVMVLVPHRLVMGLVAGAFLSFGTDLVRSVSSDAVVAGTMVIAWIVVTRSAALAGRVPPVLAALLAGIAASAVTGGFTADPGTSDMPLLGIPELVAPTWSWQACAQLVLPLAVTVIAVQNAQGAAVLQAKGHHPPVTAITVLCGVWSVIAAPFGAVSTCLAGPSNALLTAVGERPRQYIAGITCGILAIATGIAAPMLVRGLGYVPTTFVAALAGLAMLDPLRGAFTAAFSTSPEDPPTSRLTYAPLVTLLVTISGIQVLGLGAPFWGLIAGIVVARLLDRGTESA